MERNPLKKIAVLPGDGIGEEVTVQAVKALAAVGDAFGHAFETTELPCGWQAIDQYGQALPQEILAQCRAHDAVFLGAVGLPDRDQTLPQEQRPERATLLPLREGNYANLRPLWLPPCLATEGRHATDILIVRELTGGIYMNAPRGVREVDGQPEAFDTMRYNVGEIRRVARVAFDAAMDRGKRVCSVDKANILATSQLWRETVETVADEYPDVELRHQLADSAAPRLVLQPEDFDVLLTGNLFGDILSDLGAVLVGSLGMLPSACIGGDVGLFEPAHGSAPDIHGKDLANPIAAILTMDMLLDYGLGMHAEGMAIRDAVQAVLREGFRTVDLMEDGCTQTGCERFGDLVAEKIVKTGK